MQASVNPCVGKSTQFVGMRSVVYSAALSHLVAPVSKPVVPVFCRWRNSIAAISWGWGISRELMVVECWAQSMPAHRRVAALAASSSRFR